MITSVYMHMESSVMCGSEEPDAQEPVGNVHKVSQRIQEDMNKRDNRRDGFENEKVQQICMR